MTSTGLKESSKSSNLEELMEALRLQQNFSPEELEDALLDAANDGNAKAVSLLLSHGAPISRGVWLAACRSESVSVFQEFLDHGWDINSTEFGDPTLRLISSNESCVKWFLDHGADPNLRSEEGWTVLSTAAIEPSTVVLDLLISAGAELDPEALFSAMDPRDGGGIPVMMFLIDRGIDVNAINSRQGTPLHYAVRMEDKQKIRLLLEAGADRNIKFHKETPAEKAKNHGYTDLYEMLSQ